VFHFLSSLLALAMIAALARAEDPLAVLQSMYPGVQVRSLDGRPAFISGRPMTQGNTPDGAAEQFLLTHGRIFDVGQLQLERRWMAGPKDGSLKIIAYNQSIRGVPVDGGMARILIRMQPVPTVSYAAARFAGEPTVGAQAPAVSGAIAKMIATTHPGHLGTVAVGEPQLVVLRGENGRADAWTWRVPIDNPLTMREPRTVYVETRNGQVVHVRKDYFHSDITGVVRAWATPGTLPHMPGNDPVLTPLPGVQVKATVDGDTYTTFADRNGEFSFPFSGTGQTVTFNVALGPLPADGSSLQYVMDGENDPWVETCQPSTATALSLSESIESPTHVSLDLPHMSPHNGHWISQANAMIHAYRAREYLEDRLEIDVAFLPHKFRIFVNHGAYSCNAHTSGCGGTLGLFFNSPAFPNVPCYNMAYSSIVAHEYGHLVHVWFVGTLNPGFNEGFADSFFIMVLDDPVFGRNGYHSPQPHNIREDPRDVCCKYPSSTLRCSCNSYEAGMVLSGTWTRITASFKDRYGEEAGLERARKLHVNWIALTTGADGGCNSVHPPTAVEVLSLDDDDGDLGNGTPNWDLICDAFGTHGVVCPDGTLYGTPCPD
jgi:hypothetical protein